MVESGGTEKVSSAELTFPLTLAGGLHLLRDTWQHSGSLLATAKIGGHGTADHGLGVKSTERVGYLDVSGSFTLDSSTSLLAFLPVFRR